MQKYILHTVSRHFLMIRNWPFSCHWNLWSPLPCSFHAMAKWLKIPVSLTIIEEIWFCSPVYPFVTEMYCSFQKVFWHWWLSYTSQTVRFPASRGLSQQGKNDRKERFSLLPLIFATSFDSHYISKLPYYITSKYIAKKCYDHLRTISKIKGPRGNFSFEGPLLARYWECFWGHEH